MRDVACGLWKMGSKEIHVDESDAERPVVEVSSSTTETYVQGALLRKVMTRTARGVSRVVTCLSRTDRD